MLLESQFNGENFSGDYDHIVTIASRIQCRMKVVF